jgi:protein-S-isoprenylcysteine O-methyltransferase Ste14
LIGIWVSPQPRFTIPVFQNLLIFLLTEVISIPLLHLIVGVALLIPGAWLAINGVREMTLRVSETHRTERIVTTGVYSIVRHPQYLGALLAHVGISFLLSAFYATLVTLLVAMLILLISKKEEKELIREFNGEYENYMKNVPMLLPKFA